MTPKLPEQTQPSSAVWHRTESQTQWHVVAIGAGYRPLIRRCAEDARDQQNLDALLRRLVRTKKHAAETCIEQLACSLDEATTVLILPAWRDGNNVKL